MTRGWTFAELIAPVEISAERHAAWMARLKADPRFDEVKNSGRGFILPSARPPAPPPPDPAPPPPDPEPAPEPPLAATLEVHERRLREGMP